jgi:Orf78 (ac78)
MNFEVPYERLTASLKIEYIPLKLALNDIIEEKSQTPSSIKNNDHVSNKDEVEEFYFSKTLYDIMLIGLLTFFCILVILYVIYYFVILRDSQNPEPHNLYVL